MIFDSGGLPIKKIGDFFSGIHVSSETWDNTVNKTAKKIIETLDDNNKEFIQVDRGNIYIVDKK